MSDRIDIIKLLTIMPWIARDIHDSVYVIKGDYCTKLSPECAESKACVIKALDDLEFSIRKEIQMMIESVREA